MAPDPKTPDTPGAKPPASSPSQAEPTLVVRPSGVDAPTPADASTPATEITGAPPHGDRGPAPVVIGPYRVIRELGSGGMGTVYLAEDSSLRRQVALKVLPRGVAADPEMRLRFQREAEVASRLDHPNLCGVLATGEWDGQLWIAMRFVPGRTLRDEMAAAHESSDTAGASARSEAGRESWRRPVERIETLARAVHAAHEAGVVHCDLKPTNVMVTPDGTPVVLDFGLAHDLRDAVGASLTRTGQVLGTPQYMAPEQIRGGGLRSDRRIDVWALGVMLYEGIAGRHPFTAPTRDALYQQILTEDPAPVNRIVRRLPRDLAVVVATALEKSPARRYATAGALADDLRAVLEIRPIVARAPSVFSQIAKFVRRRPAVAALAVVLAIGLPTVAGLVTQQVMDMRRLLEITGRRFVEAELAIARRDPSAARGVLRLAAEVSEVSEGHIEFPMIQQQIVRLEAEIDAETLALDVDSDPDGRLATNALKTILDADPTNLRAAILLIGVHVRSGRTDLARSVVDDFSRRVPDDSWTAIAALIDGSESRPESRAESRPRTAGPDPMGFASEFDLAQALLLSARGRHLEALQRLESAMEREELAPGLAWFAAEEASRLQDYRAALAFAGRFRATTAISTPARLGRYSVHLRRAGLLAEAERAAVEAEAMARDRGPREWAVTLAQLAAVRADQSRRGEAIALLQHAIEIQPDFPEAWSSLGTVFVEERRYADAEAACRRAIELAPKQFDARVNLGAALIRLFRDADARDVLTEAVALRPDSPIAWSMLGNARRNLKDFDGARTAAERALELKPHFPDALVILGSLHHALGEREAAERRYAEALESNPRLEPALFNLALLLMPTDPSRSIAFYKRVLEVHPGRADALFNMSTLLDATGQTSEAVAAAEQATVADPNDPRSWNALGSAHAHRDEADEAAAAYLRAVTCPRPLPESHLNLMFVLGSSDPVTAWVHGRQAFAMREGFATEYRSDFDGAKAGALAAAPGHPCVIADSALAPGLSDATRTERIRAALAALRPIAAGVAADTDFLIHRFVMDDLRSAARLVSDAAVLREVEAAPSTESRR